MEATATLSGPTVEKLPTMRVPLKYWARDPEDSALEQARNLARLPIALHHVALMPDAHTGYGMPIGGVFFADLAVIPWAVGVDIGCGVRLIALDMSVDDLIPGAVEAFVTALSLVIPVGNGPNGGHAVAGPDFLDLPTAPTPAMRTILDAGAKQLGTLGGGNHFVELQAGADDRVYVMLHTGSRSVGKKVCDLHHAVAAAEMKRWRIELPDKKLAWLPWGEPQAKAYWDDMTIALTWAEESRRRMSAAVIDAAQTVLGVTGTDVIDIHHNYAAFENHFGANGIVHRKGAVRARVGETVLIPGSMGTASYVGEGLGSKDSFETCQHGAGRAMSRGGARAAMAGRDIEADLNGTILVTPDRKGVIDEAPIAYKDIESVMAASADLVRPTLKMRPLGVLKG